MAKSKYTPARIKKILDAIALSGKDKDGYHTAGIGHDTFYRWIDKHKEFSEAVAHAKELFVAKAYRTDPELHFIAVEGLKKLVVGFEERHSSVTEIEDGKGNIIRKIKKGGKWYRPPNRKAIEFLLDHPEAYEDSLPESVDFEYTVLRKPDESDPPEPGEEPDDGS